MNQPAVGAENCGRQDLRDFGNLAGLTHAVGVGWRGVTRGEQKAFSPRRLTLVSPIQPVGGLSIW